MNRLAVTCGFAAALFWSAVAAAEPPNEQADTVTIPLDRIWAFHMPDTRDVRELEPERFGEDTTSFPSGRLVQLMHESMSQRICDTLVFLDREKGERTKPGFAVLGVGRQALQATYSVLVDGTAAPTRFPVDSDITVVFFSHLFGDYVYVDEVERRGTKIEIRYGFIPHMSKDMSKHFALIPLSSLPAGKYQVEFIQLPLPAKYIVKGEKVVPEDMVDWIVCKPFTFSVVEEDQPK